MSARRSSGAPWMWAAGGALVIFLALPVGGLLLSAAADRAWVGMDPSLVWPAVRLTLLTTTVSVALIVGAGTPLAWLVARSTGRMGRAVETLLQLPVVIPPAVAGVALLLAFGRTSPFGQWLGTLGVHLPFSTAAVVMAEVFVAAPFFLQAAISAFRSVDEDLLRVARTLGARRSRVFFEVALPLTWRALVAGAAMAWARAVGEFGATLLFAGNMTGVTQTLPLAVYTALERDLPTAQALSVLMVALGFTVLLAVRAVTAHAQVAAVRVNVERPRDA